MCEGDNPGKGIDVVETSLDGRNSLAIRAYTKGTPAGGVYDALAYPPDATRRGLQVSWNNGPLQSWYDVHEAIENEFRHVRTMAVDPAADATASLIEVVQFFLGVLTVQSMHEDGVAFPSARRVRRRHRPRAACRACTP